MNFLYVKHTKRKLNDINNKVNKDRSNRSGARGDEVYFRVPPKGVRLVGEV